MRRWVQHVLPRGFVAARHYGLLANRGREEKLALCRRLLWPLVAVVVGVTAVPEREAERCPRCGGAMVCAGEVAPGEDVAVTVALAVGVDSS